MMGTVFSGDDFQFGLENALGAVYRQAADVGEVLATADRIQDGDADSWVQEWIATALYRIAHSSEPDRQLGLWTLPGYFFRAPDAAPGERRPLVVVNNGSDGATSQMWVHGGAAASERGYPWMTLNGPGQQAALFEQGIPFRPDWEAVPTPVLDAVTARADVDPQRLAVIGVSQAGFWIPDALAFEHRFAVAVVDPGVIDGSTSWMNPLSQAAREVHRSGGRRPSLRAVRLRAAGDPIIDWLDQHLS